MHNFKELKVWQKSVDYAIKIYQMTQGFPQEEKFGLTSQMRRAGVSIPSNIAEGCTKTSYKSFANSLEISLGESFELETQLEISKRIGLVTEDMNEEIQSDLSEIQRMIIGLKSTLTK
ncbi:four helix bundle protein [Echinicola soli]|uniref:Four helix bundle protein n=1 Tax=Echinicola soli TaxID=2591634 RepID=A0A514CF39_9BACT|nr:four helix bundle protein [Echinicola soli]QDH78455.1 four helix bundle protein [Echinicola soli]